MLLALGLPSDVYHYYIAGFYIGESTDPDRTERMMQAMTAMEDAAARKDAVAFQSAARRLAVEVTAHVKQQAAKGTHPDGRVPGAKRGGIERRQ